MRRMHGWVGRKDREAVEIEAVVHRDDGSKARVTLSNFSSEGCRIEAHGDFRIGEHLEIAIPAMGQVKAQVRWALPGSAGARFIAENDF
jgi:hypothetical protein